MHELSRQEAQEEDHQAQAEEEAQARALQEEPLAANRWLRIAGLSMDKEDCIQVLLTALQQPRWKSCDSVTDWDLKNILWKAGHLQTPQQVAALLADTKRRGLISGHDRRGDEGILALWGVKITANGEDWLSQRAQAAGRLRHSGAQGDSGSDSADLPTEGPVEEETMNDLLPDSPPPPDANAMWAFPENEPPQPHRP